MHVFTDYIQPLTIWLHDHPNSALFITFIISLTESLAIIGSIIPGSVTMTAVGILAGSGVMRIDLTLLAAVLGAIAGDGASYMLGYIYSDRLTSIWPFSRYPSLLSYGKEYFARHGGKSVLIGRFVGPLRSIIPVIAGMMHMNHLRFYVANIISAIAWALLYVIPGVLIGTASSELSSESATRLFIIILFLLAGIWLLSAGVKWLFVRINRILRIRLHNFWLWVLKNPYCANTAKVLTPTDELNHYPTAAVFILFIFSFLSFCLLAVLVSYCYWIVGMNQTVYLLLQSLRTHSFDIFFIILSQIGSLLALLTLIISVAFITSYHKDWRALRYWLSLNLCCALALVLMHWLIDSPKPQDSLGVEVYGSFPITELTFATALFVSLSLYINAFSQTRFKHFLKIAITCGLLILGFIPLYLGDYWLTDVLGAFFCGLSLSLSHWLLYQHYKPKKHYPFYSLLALLILFCIASIFSGLWTYRDSIQEHQPHFVQYVFTEELWWNQTKPLLPIYRTNRIGRQISLFNLQYSGSLKHLEKALANYGWQKQDDSFLNSVLTHVTGRSVSSKLPLMSQLYLNKKPVLVMTYSPGENKAIQVLRIWRSNYHLKDFKEPIWIGSIHSRATTVNIKKNHLSYKRLQSITYLSPALSPDAFLQRRVNFPTTVAETPLPIPVEPVLLLVKEPLMKELGIQQ